jgi:ATP-dependent DNA helicase RecG
MSSIQVNDPAQTDVMYLKGVGPKRARVLHHAGVETVADLLFYFPRRYLDRTGVTPISRVSVGTEVTVVGKVVTRGLLRARKPFYEVLLADDTGNLPLIWFGGIKFIKDRFKPGMTVSASGRVTDFRGPQLVHPDFEIIFEDEEEANLHTGRIIPLYPSTAELSRLYLESRGLRRVIRAALREYADQLVDEIPAAVVQKLELLDLSKAIRQMHFPESFELRDRARTELALRELLLFELLVLHRRSRDKKVHKPHRIGKPYRQFAEVGKQLPFKLTGAQLRVTSEIIVDLVDSGPMRRLLQGDVGSGKTVVAALTMALVAQSGYQAALMAPTGILCNQHYETINELLGRSGLEVVQLTGASSRAERQQVLSRLANGEVRLVVGTHALIAEDVEFSNLAYVIVDEQQRFGVEQRDQLRSKGESPDLLVMTATPIPRTLALTAYGDLDLSIIDEMPPGRKPVRTALRTDSDRPAIYRFLRDEVRGGNQVFIIYPLVQESLKLDLRDATNAYEEMKENLFPDLGVGLVHGQLSREERTEIMRRFARKEIGILVATTVVEAGIDIPDATAIVVEHAERFGLSQLHQLRGRVGRSDKRSYCILMTEMEPDTDSYKRLERFTECPDGFAISELDLEIRGPGDLLGLRQSGLPVFRVADLSSDLKLVLTAREHAGKLLDDEYPLSAAERKRLNDYIRRQRRHLWIGGVS